MTLGVKGRLSSYKGLGAFFLDSCLFFLLGHHQPLFDLLCFYFILDFISFLLIILIL